MGLNDEVELPAEDRTREPPTPVARQVEGRVPMSVNKFSAEQYAHDGAAVMHQALLLWEGDRPWTDGNQRIFAWDVAHTVYVYEHGEITEVLTVGDPAKKTASKKTVLRLIRAYNAERNGDG
jgi:hypothetical protein